MVGYLCKAAESEMIEPDYIDVMEEVFPGIKGRELRRLCFISLCWRLVNSMDSIGR